MRSREESRTILVKKECTEIYRQLTDTDLIVRTASPKVYAIYDKVSTWFDTSVKILIAALIFGCVAICFYWMSQDVSVRQFWKGRIYRTTRENCYADYEAYECDGVGAEKMNQRCTVLRRCIEEPFESSRVGEFMQYVAQVNSSFFGTLRPRTAFFIATILAVLVSIRIFVKPRRLF